MPMRAAPTLALLLALGMSAAGRAQATARGAADPVTGSVVDGRGNAVAEAAITIDRLAGHDLRALDRDLAPQWARIAVTRSDANGRFLAAAPIGVPCRVHIQHPGHADTVTTVRFTDGPQRFVLQPRCLLFGRLRRSDGTPATATLRLFVDDELFFETRTDADGSYRCDRLPPATIELQIDPDDAVQPYPATLVLQAGSPLAHDLELAVGDEVLGRVVDRTTGEPIAGAEIRTGWNSRARARSAADGSFSVRGVSREQRLHCVAPDMRREQFSPIDANVAISAGTTVHGRVVDALGAPAAGVPVTALGVEWGADRYFYFAVSGLTADDGRFALHGCGYDEQIATLLVGGAGYAITAHEGKDKSIDLDFGMLTLRPARRLVGVVRDAHGRALPDQDVWLWGYNDDRFALQGKPDAYWRRSHGPLAGATAWRNGRTDARGNFVFGDLPDGTYDVEVRDAAGKVLDLQTDLVVPADAPAPVVLRLPKE